VSESRSVYWLQAGLQATHFIKIAVVPAYATKCSNIALTAGYMILLLFRSHSTQSCLTSSFGAPRLSILMQVPPAPSWMIFAGCRIVC